MLWALRELDLEYKIIRLDFQKGESSGDKFLQLNPSGKVPVILHDKQVFTESVAIIQYLDSLSSKSIIPTDSIDKYFYDNRLMYLLTEIEPYLWVSDQSVFLSDLYEWPTHTEKSAQKILASNWCQIESWLENSSYITGSSFTAVDIIAYHVLTWASSYKNNFSANVSDYLYKLECRPAFPETMKKPGSPAKTG